jgi:hypothetical protein
MTIMVYHRCRCLTYNTLDSVSRVSFRDTWNPQIDEIGHDQSRRHAWILVVAVLLSTLESE